MKSVVAMLAAALGTAAIGVEGRLGRYMELPAIKAETMRPAAEVVAAILTALAAMAPETLPAASRSRASDCAI